MNLNRVAGPTTATQAAFRPRRDGRRTSRTRTPSRARISMSASVVNRSIRPLSNSLTRGRVMRRVLANSAWVSLLDSITFWTLINKSARTSRCSASPGAKPISRKTLPLDRVNLSFTLPLPPRRFLGSSPQNQRAKPVSCKFRFTYWSFASSFLKGVQNINALGELRHIENSMFEPCVNADFLHTGANYGHLFPIIRLDPLLDTAQLEPGNAARVWRKSFQVFFRRSQPNQRLIRRGILCEYWFTLSIPNVNEETDISGKHQKTAVLDGQSVADVAVYLQTARQIGVTIRQSVLFRGDKVIR